MSYQYGDTMMQNIISFTLNSAMYGAAFGGIKQTGVLEKLPMFGEFASGNQLQQAIVGGTAVAASQELIRAAGMGDRPSNLMNGEWKGFGDDLLYDGAVLTALDMSGASTAVGNLTGSVLGNQLAGYMAVGVAAEAANVARRRLITSASSNQQVGQVAQWLLAPISTAGRSVGV